MVPGITIDRKYDTIFDDVQQILSHYPSGTGWGSLIHYAQLFNSIFGNSREFRAYDYGEKKNWEVYGRATPKVWDLGEVKTDVVLVGGQSDDLGDMTDVGHLKDDLKNAKVDFYSLDHWDHITFIFPRDIKPLFEIFDRVLGDTQ